MPPQNIKVKLGSLPQVPRSRLYNLGHPPPKWTGKPDNQSKEYTTKKTQITAAHPQPYALQAGPTNVKIAWLARQNESRNTKRKPGSLLTSPSLDSPTWATTHTDGLARQAVKQCNPKTKERHHCSTSPFLDPTGPTSTQIARPAGQKQ